MYKLVIFTDDNELAVVPSNWLDGTGFCLWPPFKSTTKLSKAVQIQQCACDSWKAYPICLLPGGESGKLHLSYNNNIDNYERAREKLRLAEDTSDLQTADSEEDENTTRHSKRRKRYVT
ncbi:uncharacterized protein LOC124254284 [Haliotis rubra]|uniref:uncharacterized protein LOC124254284 n=1 Tax=Haliotis rubra TaxID=36100 RepID=UPI001EE5A631|nr:uncharacterized protein LOC124254284 [Haliotis rubra]